MTNQELQNLISKAKKVAVDFHGTLDSGKFVPPHGTVVITGAKPDEHDRIKEEITNLGFGDRVSEVIFNEDSDLSSEAVGKFKAQKIKEIGADLYLDNDPNQIYWIKKYNPEANVVYINRKNYVIFTDSFVGLPYALRLQEEGNIVVLAVMDKEKIGLDKEKDPEIAKRRSQIGDGLIKKYPAEKVFKLLMNKGANDIEDYFIDFDFNTGSIYAEPLEKKGYHGFFPHAIDRELEKDRQKGQDLVRERYKDLYLAEEKEFKKIDEALKFLEEQEEIFVVKCNNDNVSTYMPVSKEVEMYREEIKEFLEENKKNLEKDGFILQKIIQKPVETTPEAVYYRGKPIYFMNDIELKKVGSGDVGFQTGCSVDVNFPLTEYSKLVEVGLKPYFEIAEKEKRSTFMDASILIDRRDDKPYFGEFCFSEDTEVLTKEGWKKYNEIKVGDFVLSIEPYSQKIDWQPITKIFSFQYNGEMIQIGGSKGSSVDILVTPDHPFWVKTRSGNIIKRLAGRLGNGVQIPRTGVWEGNNIPEIIIPPKDVFISERVVKKGVFVKDKNGKAINTHSGKRFYGTKICRVKKFKSHTLPELKFKTEDFCSFLGLYLAEGSWGGFYKNEPRTIYIAQSKNNPKMKRVEEIIKRLGIKYSYKKGGFCIYSKRLCDYLYNDLRLKNTYSYNKFIPQWIKDLSPKYLKSLLEGFILGDGTWHRNQYVIVTTSKRLADDLQEIIHKLGWVSNIRKDERKGTLMNINGKTYSRRNDQYVLQIRTKKIWAQINKQEKICNYKKVDYSGIVWDVEVAQNHTLFVRRNGKAFFSSNCSGRKGYNAFITELALLPSVSHYFELIMRGKNPFTNELHPFEEPVKKFAASIRIFNFSRDKDRYIKGDVRIQVRGKNVWLWDVKMVNGKLYSVGEAEDLAMVTGNGDTLEEAIRNVQINLKDIVFKDQYYRNDIESEEWFGIKNRYDYLLKNNWL